MKKTQFESTVASIAESDSTGEPANPFLTTIKFIFADNRGNVNGQGIEESDFTEVIKTALNMPIKMRYTNSGIGGHDLSVPIGHIIGMEEDNTGAVAQLVGEAVLYTDEFPEEVAYLKTRYAEGKAPGISWELAYSDVEKKNGVEWLKGIITRAATFVKFPAYGKRTQLLAIAQNMESEELTEVVNELNELVSGRADTTAQGGMNVDEQEKAALLAKIQELETSLAAAQVNLITAQSSITALSEEKTALASENEAFKKSVLISERVAKIGEAGIKFELEGDALAAKQNFWLSMSQEVFDTYVEDLAAATKAAPKQTATAGTREVLPKFTAVAGMELTLDDMKSAGRKASRGVLADL